MILTFLPIALLYLAMLVAVIVAVVLYVRRRRAGVLIGYLDQAVRLRLPLSRYLEAAAPSESDATAARLLRIAAGLGRGAPLAHTLRWAAPEIGQRDRTLIAAAERIGRLEPALARIADRHRHARHADPQQAFVWAYPIGLVGFLLVLLTAVIYFVIPKFHQIFNDFGAALPASTVFVTDFARRYSPIIAPALASAILLGGVAMFLMLLGVTTGLGHYLVNPLVGFIPFARAAARDRALGDALTILHQALIAGAPLPDAATEAAQLGAPPFIRNRLRRFADLLHQGHETSAAARRAGLPRIDAAMLATAHNADQAQHTTRFLAHYHTTRFHRAAETARAAIMPLVVIAVGLLVGFVVYSLFAPLPALIQATIPQSQWTGGVM